MLTRLPAYLLTCLPASVCCADTAIVSTNSTKSFELRVGSRCCFVLSGFRDCFFSDEDAGAGLCIFSLWICEKCSSLGIKNCLLRVCVSLPILSLPSRELIVFVLGETRPIARLVHVAVAWRRAVQEVDPRFSRLAALELANQKAASHLGIEAGALEA
jgi:hypothetical protein